MINVVATASAFATGPEFCPVKYLFILYHAEDEDDLPYLPQRCGITWGGLDATSTGSAMGV